jgi:hypothetical protein
MKTTIVAIYDNGGETLDRYTVYTNRKEGIFNECLTLSETGAGVSMFASGQLGEHNGKCVQLRDLPDDLQRHIKERLEL